MAEQEPKKRGAKGGGTAYQRPDGLWVAEVTRDGQRHRRTAKTADEARHRLAEALGETIWDPTNPTVAQHLRKWLDGHPGKDETVHKYRQIAELHIIPVLGCVRLKELTSIQVRALTEELTKSGKTVGTVRNIKSPLSSACAQAVEDGLILENPAAIGIKGDAASRASTVNVSFAASVRLLEACRDSHLFPVWALCLYGGFRVGEALALTWDEVNLDERQISVRRNLTRKKDKTTQRMVRGIGTPKTTAANRQVPVNEELEEILRAHKEAQMAAGVKGKLLFPGKRKASQPTSQTTALRNLYRMLAKADVEKVRQHDLRHWCATLLIGKGVPIPTVSKILGHANPATTYKHYAHVLVDTERSATDVLRFFPKRDAVQ